MSAAAIRAKMEARVSTKSISSNAYVLRRTAVQPVVIVRILCSLLLHISTY